MRQSCAESFNLLFNPAKSCVVQCKMPLPRFSNIRNSLIDIIHKLNLKFTYFGRFGATPFLITFPGSGIEK